MPLRLWLWRLWDYKDYLRVFNMTQTGYLILAISIIAVLVIIFVISFVLYNKTPVPAGCEDILISDEKCLACSNASCSHHIKKEEK